MEQNPIVQRLIKAMEKRPMRTLRQRQSIERGKLFDSPYPDEKHNKEIPVSVILRSVKMEGKL